MKKVEVLVCGTLPFFFSYNTYHFIFRTRIFKTSPITSDHGDRVVMDGDLTLHVPLLTIMVAMMDVLRHLLARDIVFLDVTSKGPRIRLIKSMYMLA